MAQLASAGVSELPSGRRGPSEVISGRKGSSAVLPARGGFSGVLSGQEGGIPAFPVSGKVGKSCESVETARDACKGALTADEEILLRDIQRNELVGLSERFSRFGFSIRRGEGVKHALVRKGLINIVALPLDAPRRGITKLLEITPAAHRHLGLAEPTHREGGLRHRFWEQKTAEHLKTRGFSVEKEYPLGEGLTVDLLATRGNETVAVEVETGSSDALGNIDKCLRAGFRKVWVIALDKNQRERLQAIYPEGDLNSPVRILAHPAEALLARSPDRRHLQSMPRLPYEEREHG